ncbi:MAG: DUF1295 domain-containing protein [Bacteroidales bacterium]|nr:DUF1295 domain-containing protein [Bacteroidales bacterium]
MFKYRSFIPKGISGKNTEKQIADFLNTKGMYSIVRHPLYLGDFLMWLGLFIYIGRRKIFAIVFFGVMDKIDDKP